MKVRKHLAEILDNVNAYMGGFGLTLHMLRLLLEKLKDDSRQENLKVLLLMF